jgi:hypothetical protein
MAAENEPMKWDAYLLGRLPAEEREKLEERIFVDDSFFEEIHAAEDDLILRYWRGDLSRSDRRSFQCEYLKDAANRERAEFLRDLAALHGDADGGRNRSAARWRLALPTPHWGWAALATASLLLICWFARDSIRHRLLQDQARQSAASTKTTPLPPSHGANEPQQKSPIQQVAPALSFILTSAATRGDRGTVLEVPPGAPSIHLRLLTSAGSAHSAYRIALRTADGTPVWNGSPQSLDSIDLPAAQLANGDYLLSLEGKNARGAFEAIEDYAFRVVRR